MASRGSYPHPIIDEADDVESNFDVLNVVVETWQQDIGISYEIRTDDPDLNRLLDEGHAMHSLRWRCSSTISTGEMEPRVVQRTASGFKMEAWLDQGLVKGNVDVDFRVIVLNELNGHLWQRQHADYSGATFDLSQGDLLADGGSLRFDATKLYDPLDPPIGSCFKFEKSTSLRKGIRLDFSGDEAVIVSISATTFDDFMLFGHRPDLQIAIVVLPALMQTLDFMKTSRDEEPLEDKAWFIAIEQLVPGLGGWDASIFDLAQKILEHPIDRAIRNGLANEEED